MQLEGTPRLVAHSKSFTYNVRMVGPRVGERMSHESTPVNIQSLWSGEGFSQEQRDLLARVRLAAERLGSPSGSPPSQEVDPSVAPAGGSDSNA